MKMTTQKKALIKTDLNTPSTTIKGMKKMNIHKRLTKLCPVMVAVALMGCVPSKDGPKQPTEQTQPDGGIIQNDQPQADAGVMDPEANPCPPDRPDCAPDRRKDDDDQERPRNPHFEDNECEDGLADLRGTCLYSVFAYRTGCFNTGGGCPETSFVDGVATRSYPNGARIESEMHIDYSANPPTAQSEVRYIGADGRTCMTTAANISDNGVVTIDYRGGDGSHFAIEKVSENSDAVLVCPDGTRTALPERNRRTLDACDENHSDDDDDEDDGDGGGGPCADNEPPAPKQNTGTPCSGVSDCTGEDVECCDVRAEQGDAALMVCVPSQTCEIASAQREGRPVHVGCRADDECSQSGLVCCVQTDEETGNSGGACMPEPICDRIQSEEG